MQRNHSSPEAYRADVVGELKAMLERIRGLLLEAVDASEETIEYGMLSYGDLANLAAQKNYVALYVASEVLDSFRGRLPDCGKSCIRFRRSAQIDDHLLRELIRAVATHVSDR